MDEILIQTLSGSFSPDQGIREQAEAFLTKSEQTVGFLPSLVRIWVNEAVRFVSIASLDSHVG